MDKQFSNDFYPRNNEEKNNKRKVSFKAGGEIFKEVFHIIFIKLKSMACKNNTIFNLYRKNYKKSNCKQN